MDEGGMTMNLIKEFSSIFQTEQFSISEREKT